MEENKHKAEPTRAEMLYEERKKEEALKEKIHEEKMKNDVFYRRGYYQRELEKVFKMIPEENYYPDEYESIIVLYNKYFDKMLTLSDDKDFLDLIEKFKKKTKKVFSYKKVAVVILICFLLALGGIALYVALAYK